VQDISHTDRILVTLWNLIFLLLPGLILHACDNLEDDTVAHIYTGINRMEQAILDEVDAVLTDYLPHYRYISLGIILDGEPSLIRCYGENRLGKSDPYASVSKPVTSMITMQLVEEGLIRSLDDPVGDYCSKYKGVLPDAYREVPITFTHLLSHRSGIPHHEKIWKDGKLDLRFEPGTEMLYSTRGYGVLGDIISQIGGRSFNRLVKDYIGSPIGSSSISCPLPFFEAPGGLIQSTITDMALFASGILNAAFLDDSMLYDHAWIPMGSDRSGIMGLGWYLANPDTEELAAYHAGSNGKPRAFIVLKPLKGMGLVMMSRGEKADEPQLLPEIARSILPLLEGLEAEDVYFVKPP